MATSVQSIREIVATQASAAGVLQRFEIDLCKHANEPLAEACAKLQLSIDQVLERLADAEAEEAGAQRANPEALPTGRLIQHIVRVHHHRVRHELPRLAVMAQRLAGKHGDHAPDLKNIEALIEQLRQEMFSHIQKEEQILFPFISQMDEQMNGGGSPARACFRSVAQPIFMMMREHDAANGFVSELRRITGGFEPPDWACATHVAFFVGLRAFEADLKQHVHLENDVLFPRAIELESLLHERG